MLLASKPDSVIRFLLAILLLGLSGCVQSESSQTPTLTTPTIILTPYFSPKPSLYIQTKTPQIIPPTSPPTPTPTPLTYTVVKGDTMLAIALRNNIKLEELLAANPEVDPRLLSVGTVLIIPIGENKPSQPATATPIPISYQEPICYSSADGTWCLILITNDRSRPLENISARIVIYTLDGDILAEGIAIAPLNIIPVDESLPLVVFFPGQRDVESFAIANIISAQRVPRNDDRYLNVWTEINRVAISPDGSQADIVGLVGLPRKSLAAKQIWIAATAYNEKGEVIGVRKLEDNTPLNPGQSRPFRFNLFSLGPPISEVKVFAEARP